MIRRAVFPAGFALLILVGAVEVLALRGVYEVAPRKSQTAAPLESLQPAAGDWPWWRGSERNGIAAGQSPPVDWSASSNVTWTAPVPGRGHASPCLWGDRIFIPTADEAAQVLTFMCFDRRTGNQRWATEIHRGGLVEKHLKNSFASATPASDGQRTFAAYAAHDAVWVTAVNFDGKIAWKTDAGAYRSEHGYGSSPVLYESLVIVAGDNRGGRLDQLGDTSFVAALHRGTGEIVWRVKRANGDSFGTPIIGRISGRDQLVLSGKKCITAYDPATGKRLWHCRWHAGRTAGTVAFDSDCVYASATHEQSELICIRGDGNGDVTESHVVWREKKGAADIPSPLVHDGRLYVVSDNGLIACFDAATGETLFKKRLGGNFTGSPVLAGGNLFAVNEEGTVFAMREGPDFELLAESRLGESVLSTPAICGGQAFVRTAKSLICFGKPPAARIAAKGLPNAASE